MNLEELRKDGVFRSLTPQRQTFLNEYLTNGGDKMKAAAVAYPNCTSTGSHSAVVSKIFSNKNIRFLLSTYGGDDKPRDDFALLTKEEFLGILSCKLRDATSKPIPDTWFRLAAMYLRIVPWNEKAPKEEKQEQVIEPEREPDVDELVRQIEQTRK